MALTYDSIATTTVSGTTTATVTFSSIPGTYTDLVIVVVGDYYNANPSIVRTWFNGDTTGTNYSQTILQGDGTSATSTRATNTMQYLANFNEGKTSNPQSNALISINNYSNTTTFKTSLSRFNRIESPYGWRVAATAALWRSTSAITSISFGEGSGSYYFTPGSTFTLYGIKSA